MEYTALLLPSTSGCILSMNILYYHCLRVLSLLTNTVRSQREHTTRLVDHNYSQIALGSRSYTSPVDLLRLLPGAFESPTSTINQAVWDIMAGLVPLQLDFRTITNMLFTNIFVSTLHPIECQIRTTILSIMSIHKQHAHTHTHMHTHAHTHTHTYSRLHTVCIIRMWTVYLRCSIPDRGLEPEKVRHDALLHNHHAHFDESAILRS